MKPNEIIFWSGWIFALAVAVLMVLPVWKLNRQYRGYRTPIDEPPGGIKQDAPKKSETPFDPSLIPSAGHFSFHHNSVLLSKVGHAGEFEFECVTLSEAPDTLITREAGSNEVLFLKPDGFIDSERYNRWRPFRHWSAQQYVRYYKKNGQHL